MTTISHPQIVQPAEGEYRLASLKRWSPLPLSDAVCVNLGAERSSAFDRAQYREQVRMTDMPNPQKPPDPLLETRSRTVKPQTAAEPAFKAYGIAAVWPVCLLTCLRLLLTTIISRGAGGRFQQTFLTLNVQLLEEKLNQNGNRAHRRDQEGPRPLAMLR